MLVCRFLVRKLHGVLQCVGYECCLQVNFIMIYLESCILSALLSCIILYITLRNGLLMQFDAVTDHKHIIIFICRS